VDNPAKGHPTAMVAFALQDLKINVAPYGVYILNVFDHGVCVDLKLLPKLIKSLINIYESKKRAKNVG
jgi:hypothetical protein